MIRLVVPIFLAAPAFVLLAAPALAGQVTFTASASTPMQATGPGFLTATTTVQVPKFDRNLGRLTGVQLSGIGQMVGPISLENLDSAPYFCDGGLVAHFGYFSVSGDWSWGLPAFDGTLDYAGTSGQVLFLENYLNPSMCLSNFPGSITPCPGSFIDVTHDPAQADFYSGPGTYDRIDNASVSAHITGAPCSTPPGPVNLSVLQAVTAIATWTVTYTFEDYPARFCYFEADPAVTGGPGCPCTPSSAGCPNSQNPQGANLISVGHSSISTDTFGLAAFGMGATAPCLFFQGSSATNSGSSFGDGRRCVSGTVRRLGTKQASGGGAGYPGAQDVPIHIRGQISTPGTFAAYQVWYRDAASFCTSATYNLTSAVATVWTP